ncbi:MAG: primase [Actinomycetota bacterium]|nr:primase [Actinomycetota bacterium]
MSPHARYWRIGYADPGWDSISQELQPRHTPATLVASGLSRLTRDGRLIDTLRDRLVFPILDAEGVIGFTARARPGSSRDVPKYINTAATTLYDKSKAVYNITALRPGAIPVLVEGAPDAIAATTTGARGYVGVATCGTAWTTGHVDALTAACGGPGLCVTAFDADTSGTRALAKALPILRRHGWDVHTADLPAGSDPAGLAKVGTLRAVLDHSRPASFALAAAAIDQYSDQLQWAHSRAMAIRATAPSFIDCPPGHINALVTFVSERIHTTETSVRETLVLADDVTERAGVHR